MIDQSRIPAKRGTLPVFTPVPRGRIRHDGWTPERQRNFIEALADLGSVRAAAHAINMTPEGAYLLRRHTEAGEFRKAWEAAMENSGDSISNSNPSSGSASALTSCFPATQFRCRNPHRLAAAHHDDSGIGLDRGLPSRGSRAAHGCERAAKVDVLGLGQIFLFHGFSLHSSKAGSIPVLSYNAQSLTAIL